MSFLTKKLLFFMVLFIVCNPAFSNQECIDRVRYVFLEGTEPSVYFKFAMTSLSKKVIREKKTTETLAKHIEYNSTAILGFCDDAMYEKHRRVFNYFDALRPSLRNQSDKSLISKQDDISGYFQFLLKNLKVISWDEKQFAFGPDEYCQKDNTKATYAGCVGSLAKLFRQKPQDVIKMGRKEAFINCYENITYFDLKIEKIFGDADKDLDFRTTALHIMASYFLYIVDAAYTIVGDMDTSGSNFFPTVEEYCATPRPSSSTT